MRSGVRLAVLVALGVAAGASCHEGEIGHGLGAPCDTSTPCREPYVCDYGRCRSSCALDRDCPGGACVQSSVDPNASVCTVTAEQGCKAAGCPKGLYCGPDDVCRTGCDASHACKSAGQVCVEGVCIDRLADGGVPGFDVAVEAGGDAPVDAKAEGVDAGSDKADVAEVPDVVDANAEDVSIEASDAPADHPSEPGPEADAPGVDAGADSDAPSEEAPVTDASGDVSHDGWEAEAGGDAADVVAEDAVAGDAGDAGGTVWHDMTHASFWDIFDTTGVNPNALGFCGATFDGRYVYLVPCTNGAIHHVVARYDTQASFTDPASWATFDTTDVNQNARGFCGAAFDGRHVYLAPLNNGAFDGVVARYDTHASFTASASWATFETTGVNPNAKGFMGAVFDGRYVYLAPNYYIGVVARYDTQENFTASASWATFDTMGVNANARAFVGAVFDGRCVYLVPHNCFWGGGVVARYDTQATFTALASWSTFDTTGVNANAKGFAGAAFDGRYVYLVPSDNGALDGVVARYDTQANFTASASWSTFDTTGVNANAKGFTGAAFDGRYVYLVPQYGGVVARFDAKTPPSMPKLPGWNGSFLWALRDRREEADGRVAAACRILRALRRDDLRDAGGAGPGHRVRGECGG